MQTLLTKFSQSKRAEVAALFSIFVVGFAARLIPLLPYPHVGYDPYVHYELQNALLKWKTYIMIADPNGILVKVYYPPLFHLVCAYLSALMPKVNPYLIMEIIATSLNAAQVFPIYFLVKHFSSARGAILAALLSATTLNDFSMIAWGGYPNAICLMLIPLLIYFIVMDRPWLTLVVSTVIMLTHQLSMLIVFAILVPYFGLVIWRQKKIPRCALSFIASAVIAFLVFYNYALLQMYYVYTHYAYVYAEFTLPSNWWDLFGPLLFGLAVIGIVVTIYKYKRNILPQFSLPLIWVAVPLVLSNAYLVGIQWDSIRWVLYLAQPLAFWAGISVPAFQNRRWLYYLALVLIAATFLYTMTSYYHDIAVNSQYQY